jgi:hypothetical protein
MTNHISSGEVSAGRTVGSQPLLLDEGRLLQRTAVLSSALHQAIHVNCPSSRACAFVAIVCGQDWVRPDDAWIDLSSRPRESENAS